MDTASISIKLSTAVKYVLSLGLEIFDEKVEVLSGYPANCTTWLTIYHHRKSDRWTFEWYDKLGCWRPALPSDISVCMMRNITDHDVSSKEHAHARMLLAQKSYYEA